MQMTSTLWGMENYFKYKSKSLFDDIRLPDGVDKQTLVNTILLESGELELIYTDGDFLRVAINTWFERKYSMLDRWIKAINTEYKPLENYNRTETWTDTSNGKTTNTGSKNSTMNSSGSNTDSSTNNGTVKMTDTNSSKIGAQTSSDETKTSAFNTSDYSPNQKEDVSVGERTDTSNRGVDTTTRDTLSRNGSFTNESTVEDTTSDNGTSSNTSEHTGNMYGNIGVTTSQQMLEAEMKLWGKIDIYKDTAEMFVQDFCILVY